MSDYFQYLFILVLLYLSECFQKTGPSSWVFQGKRALRRFYYPGNGTWGWVFANPLRPWEPLYGVHPLPFVFTTKGICTDPRYAGGDSSHVNWAVARNAKRDGSTIVVGTLKLGMHSPYAADRVVRLLHLGSTERALAAMFDANAGANELARFRPFLMSLNRCSGTLGLLILVFWPLCLPILGFAWSLAPVVAGLYGVGQVAGRILARIMHTFFLVPEEKFSHRWKLGLYPLSTWRAADLPAQDLLAGMDRSIGAILVLGKEARRSLLIALYREAKFPPVYGLNEQTAAALKEGFHLRLERLAKLLEQDGISTSLAPPARCGSGVQRWCPVCLAQYRRDAEVCRDCQGIVLESFEEARG